MKKVVNSANISNLSSGKFVVGLTGGIGSGKTRVANVFSEFGATIIDADAIAHQLTAPGGRAITAIRTCFGDDFITPSGAMDRVRMRECVFSDRQKKAALEAILHPMIREEVIRLASEATGPYIVCVVPLLAGNDDWSFSRILVIDCDEESQIERVMKRDKLSKELIQSIIRQQTSRQQRLAFATDVIQNNAEFDTLRPEILRLHKTYIHLSSANQTDYL